MTHACPIKIECDDLNPFANLSSEGADPFYYRAVGYCCDTKLKEAWSTDSFQAANEAVNLLLQTDCANCPSDKNPDNDDVTKYCAEATCPDGTLLAEVCVTTSQEDADNLASIKEGEMASSCSDLTSLFKAECSCPSGDNAHTVYSANSQAEADALCAAIPKNCDDTGSSFGNVQQSCGVQCPDGTWFYYYVRAGMFHAGTLAAANAAAEAYACLHAASHKICLSNASFSTCVGSEITGNCIKASGTYLSGSANSWEIVSGSLPDGVTFNDGYVLGGRIVCFGGTPTTAGLSTFTVRVTAPNGDYMQKVYTICVLDIDCIPAGSDASHMPNGTVGTDYAAALNLPTCATGPYSFQVTVGTLPPGLTIEESTGVVSGTPTTPGDYTFTVSAQTEAT